MKFSLPPYLFTLRLCFPTTWRAQRSALERILPFSLRRPRRPRGPLEPADVRS